MQKGKRRLRNDLVTYHPRNEGRPVVTLSLHRQPLHIQAPFPLLSRYLQPTLKRSLYLPTPIRLPPIPSHSHSTPPPYTPCHVTSRPLFPPPPPIPHHPSIPLSIPTSNPPDYHNPMPRNPILLLRSLPPPLLQRHPKQLGQKPVPVPDFVAYAAVIGMPAEAGEDAGERGEVRRLIRRRGRRWS